MTGKPVETYGWGGASSGEINRMYRRGLIDAKYTGTLSQIEEYAEGRDGADPAALYLIFAGSNDLNVLVPDFSQDRVDAAVAEVSSNLEAAIRRLHGMGATMIAVATRTARPVLSDALRPAEEQRGAARNDAAGRQLNASIRRLVARMDAELDAKVALLDSYAIIRDLIDGSGTNGFAAYSETEDAYCVRAAACETLINFDGAHKTSAVHRELAKALIAMFGE